MQSGLVERREALEAIASGLSQQAEAVESRLTRLTDAPLRDARHGRGAHGGVADSVRERTEETTQQASGVRHRAR